MDEVILEVSELAGDRVVELRVVELRGVVVTGRETVLTFSRHLNVFTVTLILQRSGSSRCSTAES